MGNRYRVAELPVSPNCPTNCPVSPNCPPNCPEPDGDIYRTAIKTAPVRLMSAVPLLETRLVLFSRLGSNAITAFDELIARAGIVVEPFDESLASAAFDAFRKYGKEQSNSSAILLIV